VENEVYNQDWRSRGKLQIFQYQVLKWTLALIVGLVVALVGFFNNIAVENIAGFKLLLTSNLMLHNRYRSYNTVNISLEVSIATVLFFA
jgi:chloride channel 7